MRLKVGLQKGDFLVCRGFARHGIAGCPSPMDTTSAAGEEVIGIVVGGFRGGVNVGFDMIQALFLPEIADGRCNLRTDHDSNVSPSGSRQGGSGFDSAQPGVVFDLYGRMKIGAG
jgi:hypothetical protein